MQYRQAGNSGIQLPVLSLGLWHNFGDDCDMRIASDIITTAFDYGISHFDLANNYGPAPGSAERNFGTILHTQLSGHRDELFISSKAGHDMWPGVYGNGSSRKNIIASCDQSLRRTHLEYFDIFYSHRYDGFTPIEETMEALIQLVRQGKALYVGISKYPPEQQQKAYDILRQERVPCLLSQYKYNLLDQQARDENFQIAADNGSGIICFSPLAQGLLTDKYLNDIPQNSRAASASPFLTANQITPELQAHLRQLNQTAQAHGKTLAQYALSSLLTDPRVTSVIIGASSTHQLLQNLKAID